MFSRNDIALPYRYYIADSSLPFGIVSYEPATAKSRIGVTSHH